MARRSDPRLLVLHALRIKGLAEPDVVGNSTGISSAGVTTLLAELASADRVVRRDGPVSGWALTPAGRRHHAELLATEVGSGDVRSGLDAAYRGFVGANAELLAVCTAWQLRDGSGPPQINDHTDATYDRGVVDRLIAVDDAGQAACRAAAAVLARFSVYGPRLSAARARVAAGDGDWFTKPTIASYHTVWFELHEDFLVSLGIPRAREETG